MVKLSCYELGNATGDGIYDLHLLFDDAASGNGVLAKLRLLHENVRLLPPVFDMPQRQRDDDDASGDRGRTEEDSSDVSPKGCFLSIRFFTAGAHRAKEAVYAVLMEHLDPSDQSLLRQDLAQSKAREAQVSAHNTRASGDDPNPSGFAVDGAAPAPA